MRLARRASILIGFVIALAACVPTAVPPLDGTQWSAVRVDDMVLPERPPIITFQRGGASGSGLCSRFTIKSVTVDNTVTPSGLAYGEFHSSSGCINDERQRLDTAFLDALTQAGSIKLVGCRLVIDGPGARVIFELVLVDSSGSS